MCGGKFHQNFTLKTVVKNGKFHANFTLLGRSAERFAEKFSANFPKIRGTPKSTLQSLGIKKYCPGQSAENFKCGVGGFLLYKFWRIFPGIFLEEFSGHFFPQK